MFKELFFDISIFGEGKRALICLNVDKNRAIIVSEKSA